jgi:multidrug efflux pump subunit AcrB
MLLFLALATISILIVPRLSVDLLPHKHPAIITVMYSVMDSNPELMEQQVTSVIEGACSQISDLEHIVSFSGCNTGYVELEFKKGTDMEYKRFELTSILRQVYPSLPAKTSYPAIVNGNNQAAAQSPLLVYSIHGPFQPFYIRQAVEEVLRKSFAGINAISDLRLSGAEGLQVTIQFDKNKCNSWGIEPRTIMDQVVTRLSPWYSPEVTGEAGKQYQLKIANMGLSLEDIGRFQIVRSNKQPVYLRDIALVYLEEQQVHQYFRINGNNSINLSLYAREGENNVLVSQQAKEVIKKAQAGLPKDISIRLEYDNTVFLEQEIAKTWKRALISVSMLLLFIFLAYRKARYVGILLSGLLVSFCLTLLAAWVFNVNIHLYTIAGLAISFGIMLDNCIVMVDHYSRYRNRKILLPILGATFTTVAALGLVVFLPEEEKANLVDFSIIIILSLLSSVVTAGWFTPAVHFYIGKVAENKIRPRIKRLRRTQLVFATWQRVVGGLATYRKTFLLGVVLCFGLPFFMLPDEWEGNQWYHRWYNAVAGKQQYREEIKPRINKWLGGALYAFVNNVYEKSGYRDPGKTRLFVAAELPYGNTPQQMDYMIGELEKYLRSVDGVDKFVATVHSGQYGSVEITFKDEYEQTGLPFILKSKLIARSLDWGGVNWTIYGVGNGFSNAGAAEIPHFKVIMKGYNYGMLDKQVSLLESKLLHHPRIQKVNRNDQLEYGEKPAQEYILSLDPLQMAMQGTNQYDIVSQLSYMAEPAGAFTQVALNNKYYPVYLKEKGAADYSIHDLKYGNLLFDSGRITRIGQLGQLNYVNTPGNVRKEDRQYVRVVGFEYHGSLEFGSQYLKQVLDEMRQQMPVGYSAVKQKWKYEQASTGSRYLLIGLLLLAIFVIGSILFESLKQPLAIICTIPVSFIGLFIAFTAGGFFFDQGGYAAFVMLGGLVANASIFIVNDFNNLRKGKPERLSNRMLIKAVMNRSRTILLTTLATNCGFVPFLLEGQQEVFWFALGVGTIGGLLCSLLGVLIVLPVLLYSTRSAAKNTSITKYV